MSPSRKCTVGSHKIEEYYWAGGWPVYIDNRLTKETYTAAVHRLLEAEMAEAQ